MKALNLDISLMILEHTIKTEGHIHRVFHKAKSTCVMVADSGQYLSYKTPGLIDIQLIAKKGLIKPYKQL